MVHEATECLEPIGDIVAGSAVGRTGPELAVAVVMVSLYPPLFEPAVHPVNLAIGHG